MARKGLGKGLDALIPSNMGGTDRGVQTEMHSADGKTKGEREKNDILWIRISEVEPNKEQPRRHFEEDSLEELADSIRQYGILQPILVQKREDYYEIIAGERRWRAAQKAGLAQVPILIKEYNSQELLEVSLIENIQRENLNPIEEARAYRRLLEEHGLKHDQIAERLSKSRTAITNSMRLLKLSEEVQQMLVEDMISSGHARALLGIDSKEEQAELAQKVFDEQLSVRDVEKIIKDRSKPKREEKPGQKSSALYQDLEERLKTRLGTKVNIQEKGRGRGKIEIEFYNQEDLDRVMEIVFG